MDIIPVMDVRNGKLIQAASARGRDFREFRSNITSSSDPLDLAVAYEKIGFKELYISDLDGILDAKPNYDVLRDVSMKTGLSVMADIGVWTMEDVLNLEKVKPVIASETFSSLNMISFPGDFVLSLDTRDGVFLSAMDVTLKEFVKIIRDSRKVSEILVIDLSRVGMPKGPNLDLCKYVIGELPGKTVMYGGGVRNMLDIEMLFSLGITKVCVGSALHSGSMLKEIYSGLSSP
jgi:phosphoribosylformimino-5-aminoimidazole carboxamide ribotide isomerase